MTEGTMPQLYLVTPLGASVASLMDPLAALLEISAPACLRLRAGDDPREAGRLTDAVRVLAHGRDIPVVIDTHIELARAHCLDGVHLLDGARSVRAARKTLGADAIVGAFCGASRHDGMNAAEAGADYVAFGPVGGSLGGPLAETELFAWWSEMIEVPVVAEGGLDAAAIARLAPVADFIALGAEVWSAPDPAAALESLWR